MRLRHSGSYSEKLHLPLPPFPLRRQKKGKGREDDPSFPTFSTKLKKKERKRSRELAKVDCAYLLLLPLCVPLLQSIAASSQNSFLFPLPSPYPIWEKRARSISFVYQAEMHNNIQSRYIFPPLPPLPPRSGLSTTSALPLPYVYARLENPQYYPMYFIRFCKKCFLMIRVSDICQETAHFCSRQLSNPALPPPRPATSIDTRH